MIDFIIPHMGRTEMLIDTIESIYGQSDSNLIGRIIVVTKNRGKLDLPASSNLKIVQAPEHITISEQRNIGVSYSNASYLAFIDADIRLAPDWAKSCFTLLEEDPQRVLVSAAQRCLRTDNAIEQLRTTLSNVALDQNVAFLPGRNLLVSKEHHLAVGGFPAHLQTCEDYYYTDRLHGLGSLYYTSKTYYYHLGEDLTLGQTFKKEIWRSQYNLLSIRGRKVPVREWPSFALPFLILGTLIAALLTIHSPLISLFFALSALLPAAIYTTRLSRYRPEVLSPLSIFAFYCVYFFARTIGTVQGSKFLWLRNDRHAN